MEKKRILIVDDEATFTRMVRLNLEATGEFEVREEHRATAALASAREFKPHLILLDVIMPSMDGGDLADQIRNDRMLRETPIVFLTATVSRREAGDDGLNSGGSLFLAKPVSVDSLLKCIHDHLKPKEEKPNSASP
jgi:CheY-like chemotaxis protein